MGWIIVATLKNVWLMCCTLIFRYVALQYWGQILSLWHRIVDLIPQSGTKNSANGICPTVVFTWMNDFPIVVSLLVINKHDLITRGQKTMRFQNIWDFLVLWKLPLFLLLLSCWPFRRGYSAQNRFSVFYLTTCKGGWIYDLLKGSSSWLEVNSPPPTHMEVFFEIY